MFKHLRAGYRAGAAFGARHGRKKHVCKADLPIGTLKAGDLTYHITRVYFEQGHLVLHAVARTSEVGHMRGHAEIYGLDGVIVYRSMTEYDEGIKTSAMTWALTDAIRLPSLLDVRPPFDHERDRAIHRREGDR